jgi:uncharacterized protein
MDRRKLLQSTGTFAALISIAVPLRALFTSGAREDDSLGYGPLVKDPGGLLDLPAGFRYEVLSRTGELMTDGFRVPGAHDGMAAFRGRGGNTLLVRNHELSPHTLSSSPFTAAARRPSQLYDPAGIGGTTTLEVDREGKLVRHFLSLAGTVRNCAGGPTPWGSWVSCEETVGVAGQLYAPERKPEEGVRVRRTHGYNFEVDAGAEGLVRAVPLQEMGRFNHEAIAVDPRTGYVYQTEDRGDGALYRFRPHVPGKVSHGGSLEALRIPGFGSYGVDTSNGFGTRARIAAGKRYPVEWVPISDPDPKRDTVRHEAWYRGAAAFARGEGIYYSRGSIYFACTSGGPERLGQIWRLRPGAHPSLPDSLELFIEVGRNAPLKNPDNLCVSRAGELVICEDGSGDQFVVGATRQGRLYRIARNALNRSEFAGATFSPDGRILFVNIQSPGITFAIQGPWRGQANGETV